MTDLSTTVAPKSDQLNSDDLISGPRTITVRKVSAMPGEQPIGIFFEGDDDKPYKPCKSMRRVLIAVWGKDGNQYAGRRMTLYRDPKVLWGGMEVGGIRISHVSHIEGPHTMALTETKKSRKPYTVKPLAAPQPTAPAEPTWADKLRAKLVTCTDAAQVGAIERRKDVQASLGADAPLDVKAQVRGMLDAAYDRCRAPDTLPDDDGFPGATSTDDEP